MFCPAHKKLMRHEEGLLKCPMPGCGATKTGKEASRSSPTIQAGDQRIDKTADVGVIEDAAKFGRQEPIDDQVSCDKCGNRGAYYYLRQTRKSDEPTTAFYTCTNKKCGNKWKRAH